MFQILYFCLILGVLTGCGHSSSDSQESPKHKESLSLDRMTVDASKTCGVPLAGHQADQEPLFRFEEALITKQLSTEGLRGYMHGVVLFEDQFVFTYRSEDPNDPMAFFQAEEFSLIPATATIKAQLQALHRHDKIILKGTLLPNGSPFRHILVENLDLLEPYPHQNSYDYEVEPEVFQNQDQVNLLTKVHAIVHDGKGLILEWRDLILPVKVHPQHVPEVATLYRNDKLVASLRIERVPGRPLHFSTDPEQAPALEIIDPIQNCHGKATTLEGVLVMYKKSPQINRDIFAVRIQDANGIVRNFTFFPHVDFSAPDANKVFMDLFEAFQTKANKAWTSQIADAEEGRNHLLNRKIKVSVQGTMNIISKSQANPQIYIKNPDDLQLSIPEQAGN